MTRFWRQLSPIGELTIVAGDAGILRIGFGPAGVVPPDDAEPGRDDGVARELDDYFAGRARVLGATADLRGVEGLRRRVYEILRRDVPWGETVSYGELADMADAPRAARAVGNAMARNPVPIMIPCHRVIAADGRIGGYGPSGIPTKRALLAIEGVALRD